ncbi:DUF2927 domain-containing protein [Sulfitobacter sp. S223]|uniref:DUF2927 domain-containing protein n=1 Tax=Sulfitobacter sp. S223 TaxID=2867023 RepID=UPI0021A41693|nr:DUF2927 domain-containing protein [Sulfitobacter sp. S223]UWR27316.1 DUF2927 domain-containing protein [Sulfitobacter sp. S223]
MLLACAALPALAQDFVESEGALDDMAFYRLVACGASPDGICAKPFYHWDQDVITVGIVERAPSFLGGKLKRAEASVVRAVQRLNKIGMGVRLVEAAQTPDIKIYLLDAARGDRIAAETATLLDGLIMANAITALDIDGNTIKGASIGFSTTMTIRQYESVMLEEITQALGLITDIRNPYYLSRSILSQDADNSLKTLGAQDKMALVRHYPPQ